ncbi:MAG: undecaprenyl-diphosphatase UppP [Candidatus Eremiobacteraeota bacterium]|nr:undecaprenyl-diphosphatase UppP [Candidatus Eremiobacteraeota bacterium]
MKLSIIQTIILGIIQGLTEFLPISSSGHLILVREVFHFPDPGKVFDVILHMGTLIALVIYFWNDLTGIVKSFIKSAKKGKFYGDKNVNLFWFLIISTIPGGLFGFIFKDKLEELKNVYLISVLLIVFGILLLVSDRVGKKEKSMEQLTWKDAVFVGLMQALALFPGVSRSGVCMTTALFLGFTREVSARFSFLVSIPLIAGVSAYGVIKIIGDNPDGGAILIYAVGLVTAAVSGFFCIKFLLDYLKKGTFLGFAIYRFAIGLLLIILGLMGFVG